MTVAQVVRADPRPFVRIKASALIGEKDTSFQHERAGQSATFFLREPTSARRVEHREVLDAYAPLAHKLGLSVLKRELEDAAFAELHPDEHTRIAQLIAEHLPDGDAFVATTCEQADAVLREAKLDARVHGRIKRSYSIYQKMAGGLSFDDIYDLVGVRVVVQSTAECYYALGILHAHWKPVPGRFKDYIAAPKANSTSRSTLLS